MKPLSEILHRTPWWALIFGGLATLVALAVFVTPYHIIRYQDDGARTVDENRAIKREIDNTFAENAINIGRGVVRGMLERTTDPDRRAELEEALRGLEEARIELHDAGNERLKALREEFADARESTRQLRRELRDAKREARKLPQAERESAEAAYQALEAAVDAAVEREAAVRQALRDAGAGAGASISIGPGRGDRPMIEIEVDPPKPPAPPVPGAPALPPAPAAPGAKAVPPGPSVQPPPLPPEVARKIRRDVTRDMYRVGIGAALLMILLPLFVLAIIAKFFLDRSRASQRVAETKRKEADYHRMSQQVTEAKLAALQAQVEPHFLYNTLASVQALTEVDPARASEMTGHLIQYLRNALPKMRESVSTVGQEVELVRAYLSILQMRMGARLAFTIAVPESLAGLPFPPLMLPSLVENAIKHGLEPQREGGAVHIGADLSGERLRLVVSDTGRGFAEVVGAGVGLANIRERLAALYGERASLTLEANTPRGVIATIEVPASGTRSGAFPGATPGAPLPEAPRAARFAPPPSPGSPQPEGAARTGFWPRAWGVLVTMERLWRVSLYYIYLGLLGVAGILAIAAIVGAAVGAIPLDFDDDLLRGPGGAFVGLAAVIIVLVVVAVALAIVMAAVYGIGFLALAVLIFALLAVAVGISPVVLPIALVVAFIWWMARRSGRKAAAQGAAAPEAARVEPTLGDAGEAPAPSGDRGR